MDGNLEKKTSAIITPTPLCFTVPARVSDVGRTIYLPLKSRLKLGCQAVGDPVPSKKWFLNGRDDAWLNRKTAAHLNGQDGLSQVGLFRTAPMKFGGLFPKC